MKDADAETAEVDATIILVVSVVETAAVYG